MYSVHRLIGHWKDRLGYELGHNYVVVGWSVHFVLMRYWSEPICAGQAGSQQACVHL